MPDPATLWGVLMGWGPPLVTTAAAIGINRTLKRHDKMVDQLTDHETRLVAVETRCEERGSC
ncbi:MAG: hypothetical protein M0Z38_08445 [Deltaproteobacteria bacterium]|nr:hypothetical protein [Deltaproteobacteria bacterium]